MDFASLAAEIDLWAPRPSRAKGGRPPYDAVLLLSRRAARNTRLKAAFRPLIDAISNEEMRQANMLVDLKKSSISQAADWLFRQIEAGHKPE